MVPPEEDGLGILFSGFGIVGRNDRVDTSAHIKIRVDLHPPRLRRFDQVIQDLIGDLLMERSFIAVAPEVEFQALKLHAEFIRDVADTDLGEIRLTGLGTEAREFRAFDMDRIIAPRVRIFEDLEFL